jgi:GTPase SAR1 family protein
MIAYDITSPDSLGSIKQWIMDVNTYAPSASKLIVGNKSDLTPRAVEFDVAKVCIWRSEEERKK